ncbi:MAG TPA: hypothetical protein VNJ29_03125 [Candidatus Nitrosotenuis sp.]|jgi:hypothetical protein|nr:hypothetical protein [Candidatus Nitrosotenuis sp.]
MAILYGPQGQITTQEHLTQLGTNVAQNDALSMLSGMQSQIALQSAHNQSHLMNEQIQMGINKLFSLAQTFSKSTAWNESFGDAQSVHAQQSLNQAMNMAKQFAKDHHVSEDKAFHILLNAGVGTSRSSSSILGKLGNLLSANATGQFDAAGKNNKSISQNTRNERAKQFADSLKQGFQYIEDHKGSLSDAFQRQKMDQVQHHFNQARQYSDQITASLQQSHQMWSQTAAQQRQKSISSGSNINDEILGYVANKKFGWDKGAAAAWQSQHSLQYQKLSGSATKIFTGS